MQDWRQRPSDWQAAHLDVSPFTHSCCRDRVQNVACGAADRQSRLLPQLNAGCAGIVAEPAAAQRAPCVLS